MKVCLLVLLFAASAWARTDDAKANPVLKVVAMLKDMGAQLKAEAEGDEEAYDKMQCYCRTNDAEKSKAIADGEQRSKDLASTIESNTAKSSTLTSEIETLNGEIAENKDGLAKSTDIRNKERNGFNEMAKNA